MLRTLYEFVIFFVRLAGFTMVAVVSRGIGKGEFSSAVPALFFFHATSFLGDIT